MQFQRGVLDSEVVEKRPALSLMLDRERVSPEVVFRSSIQRKSETSTSAEIQRAAGDRCQPRSSNAGRSFCGTDTRRLSSELRARASPSSLNLSAFDRSCACPDTAN